MKLKTAARARMRSGRWIIFALLSATCTLSLTLFRGPKEAQSPNERDDPPHAGVQELQSPSPPQDQRESLGWRPPVETREVSEARTLYWAAVRAREAGDYPLERALRAQLLALPEAEGGAHQRRLKRGESARAMSLLGATLASLGLLASFEWLRGATPVTSAGASSEADHQEEKSDHRSH